MIKPTQYCVFPFNYPFIDNDGYVSLCCKNLVNKVHQYHISEHSLLDIWNSPEIQAYRDQFQAEQSVSGCWKCYDPERAGVSSFRSRTLDSMNNGEPFQDTKIRALDLRLGNTCNLACIMCSPQQSNRMLQHVESAAGFYGWEPGRADKIKQRFDKKLYGWADQESSWTNIMQAVTPDLKRVYIAGGEPFYLKHFADAMYRLTAAAPQATISINSNGTRLLREKDLSKFSPISDLTNIRLSIDGFGKSDEFTRQGTDWQEKIAVIDQYYQTFGIQVWDITVNVFTVTSTVELIQYLKNTYPDVPFAIRPVTNIPEMSLPAIPEKFRTPLLEFLVKNGQHFSGADHTIQQLSKPYVPDDIIKQKMRQTAYYWQQHGSGVKLADFAPELAEWLM